MNRETKKMCGSGVVCCPPTRGWHIFLIEISIMLSQI